MTHTPDEPTRLHNDPQHSPPREVVEDIATMLRGALPPPADDTPTAWARRDLAAMETVVCLQPANAAEARLAVQFVALDAHSSDCLRQAREQHKQPKAALKCMAQATKMMRESKKALNLLMQLQARRRATAKFQAAANRAAWAEYNALERKKYALAAAAKLRPAASNEKSSIKTSLETTVRPQPPLDWSDFGEPGAAVH